MPKKKQTLNDAIAAVAASSDNPMAGHKPKFNSDDLLSRINATLDAATSEGEFTLADVLGALHVAAAQVDEEIRINTRRNVQARDMALQQQQQGHTQD